MLSGRFNFIVRIYLFKHYFSVLKKCFWVFVTEYFIELGNQNRKAFVILLII